MTIYEYHCKNCKETFLGDGGLFDEHSETEQGIECGGYGELVATYTNSGEEA